jgi:phosphoribosylformylglycinamidine cyclo-ligase
MCGLTSESFLSETGSSVGDALLAPHRSYLRVVEPLLTERLVKGMAHITGGGLTENVPRFLPAGCEAQIDRGSWPVPPLFEVLQRQGDISDREMLRSFNMGVGLVIACAASDAARARRLLLEGGEKDVWVIGHVGPGDRTVRYGAAR